MSKEKRIWLQIPNEIIRNTGFNIDEKSFAIYAFLLFKRFQAYNNGEIDVLLKDIKFVTGITDNRTVKKCFSILSDQDLIRVDFDSLPINNPIHFKMLKPYKENYFTQIPLNLLKSLDTIGVIGFRLMYYYESFINRENVTKQFCYPSYETIQEDLGISNFSVTKYNKLLVKEKLITITKHKVEYDPFGDGGLERFNNHYSVNLHMI
ncbi:MULTISPECIES: hypothetical protein [Lysinibacillus]|uniref:hypothetical protein n=1 Tax=Lysinibacillus TaxID=400634 RepID=UPI00214C3D68|nr:MULTISPECIES: hypothetical protein [Lysinibacillus]UUV25900.1 hypothetical protein NP781_04590 [Lysinibacillus sp. FN11]UYB48773.1 hypothetical protein OCI51_07380 [Lysinibacillus capsici]